MPPFLKIQTWNQNLHPRGYISSMVVFISPSRTLVVLKDFTTADQQSSTPAKKLLSPDNNYWNISMKMMHIWLVMSASICLELCLAAPLVANNTAAAAATATTPYRVCPCKKRPHQYLINLFTANNSNASCFNIEVLPIPARRVLGQNTTSQRTAEDFFSTLSVHTHCLHGLRQSSECFDFPQCTWAQEMQHTGHGAFPQFEMHAACMGCSRRDERCLADHNRCYYNENTITYRPLVREQRCDQDGYEVWRVAEQRSFTAACSCLRA